MPQKVVARTERSKECHIPSGEEALVFRNEKPHHT